METQLHVSEILLYELAVDEELSAGLAPTQRLELLWKCARATRSMLETRFRKGGDDDVRRRRFTGLATFDYAYAMIVCLRLSSLGGLAGWDLGLLRRELDFDRYLVLQIEELREFTAQRTQGPGPEHDDDMDGGNGSMQQQPFQDPYTHLHDKLVKIRACIVAEMAATMPPDGSSHVNSEPEHSDAAGADGTAQHRDMSKTTCTDAVVAESLEGGFSEGLGEFDDAFRQNVYRDTEWEANMSALLAWGFDDAAEPSQGDGMWTASTL